MDSDLTSQEKVRLQLERSLAHDARVKSDKQLLFESAIKPVWIGENGTIKVLGQEPTTAFNSMPNLHYGAGEEMRPIPVGAGGRMSADNKSYLPVPVPTPQATPPKPSIDVSYDLIFHAAIQLYVDGIPTDVFDPTITVSGSTASPASFSGTESFTGCSAIENATGLTATIAMSASGTDTYKTGFWNCYGTFLFTNTALTTAVIKSTINEFSNTETLAIVGGYASSSFSPIESTDVLLPQLVTFTIEIISAS